MHARSRIHLFVDDGHPEAVDYDTSFAALQPHDGAKRLEWTAPDAGPVPAWRRRLLLAACTAGSWLRCLFAHRRP